MADLLSILTQGANGLSAHRAAAQTAAHNIQNVNTEGYSRQRVELEAMSPEYLRTNAYAGMGVTIGAITQSRDAFLERQIPASMSANAQYSAESQSLRSVVALNPDSKGGLTDSMANFYSDLRLLGQFPSQPGLRAAVIGSARNLAYSFNRTAEGIAASRSGIDARVASDIEEANSLGARVADLNSQIVKSRAVGGEPNDLLDERRKASDRLSALVGANPIPDADGNLNMALPNGMVFVSGQKAGKLTTAPDPANAGFVGVQITKIGSSTPEWIASSGIGGEVRGFIDARDVTLKQSLASLDTLAFDFANTLNTQHQAGFDLNGNAGQAVFNIGATSPGASSTISINAALVTDNTLLATSGSVAGVPGDSSNVLAMIATERTTLSGGTNAASTLAGIISAFGSRTREAGARADQEGAIASNLSSLRESVAGVSLDEEMINMSKAQRAFDAVSKVISTADDMLNTLMSLR
jgi:flagellar hook-associated protein 1